MTEGFDPHFGHILQLVQSESWNTLKEEVRRRTEERHGQLVRANDIQHIARLQGRIMELEDMMKDFEQLAEDFHRTEGAPL